MSEELGRDLSDLLREVDALELEAARYRAALLLIRDTDDFMRGPIAPPESPVVAAMREIAADALSGSRHGL